MIKRILFFIFFIFSFSSVFAQNDEAQQLLNTAKTQMNEGDFEKASSTLNDAIQKDPNNIEILKTLAFVDYLKKDYAGSIDVCKKITERPDADEQTFQMLGMNYKAIAENKECAKMYKAAIKKFPESGVLYNEYGELLASDRNLIGAIEQWEKGIEVAPNYSSNYYNAANYYSRNNNLIKEVIYGEIFVNLESYTTRTASVKTLLLDGYTKLYSSGILNSVQQQSKPSFSSLFTQTLSKNKNVSFDGQLAEIFTSVRTRFILDWFGLQNNIKFPYHLFDYLQYLLHEGYFEAYNQWIFGAAQSPSDYQTWLETNGTQANNFTEFQKGRVFRMPQGQNYK